MFWDDPNDSENEQRLKNMALMDFWGTNEERDAALPYIGGAVLILLVILALVGVCSR